VWDQCVALRLPQLRLVLAPVRARVCSTGTPRAENKGAREQPVTAFSVVLLTYRHCHATFPLRLAESTSARTALAGNGPSAAGAGLAVALAVPASAVGASVVKSGAGEPASHEIEQAHRLLL
jgi:hypothetical protein